MRNLPLEMIVLVAASAASCIDFQETLINPAAESGVSSAQSVKSVSEEGTAEYFDSIVKPNIAKVANHSPIFETESPQIMIFEGHELQYTARAIDPERDRMTYTTENLPEGARFVENILIWTPNYEQQGEYEIKVKAIYERF